MKPYRGRRRSRFPRVLLAAAAILIALFLAHLLTARWLLSGPRLRGWINAEPEEARLDWDSAVSIWPGRVRLRNLQIRGSDQNVQWIIRLEDARVRYSVLALATRTFRALRVDGAGLSFRIRQKLEPSKAKSAKARLLPPVPGFPDPPLRQAAPPPEPPGNPWKVDVQNVFVPSLRELWVDGYRWKGTAKLDGRFFLRPGRHARIGPATIEFAGGDVALGPLPVGSALAGTLAATFADWDPEVVQGDEVWEKVSARIQLRAGTKDLAFLGEAFGLGDDPRLSGGKGGALTVEGTIEKGVARGGAGISAGEVRIARDKVTLVGDLAAQLRTPKWVLHGGPLQIDGSRLELKDVRVAGDTETRDWWGRFRFVSGTLDGGLAARVETRCRDARPLFALLGAKLPRWTRGLLELDSLEATADVAFGPGRTVLHDLEATGGRYEIEGEYLRRGERADGVFLIDARGPLSVGVRVGKVRPGVHLFGARKWFQEAEAQVRGARDDSP